MENDFFLSEIRPGVKEQGGSPPPRITRSTPQRSSSTVLNNANNGQGLHTRATREKRADRKRNDFKALVPVTTPPAPLSLTPSFSFL